MITVLIPGSDAQFGAIFRQCLSHHLALDGRSRGISGTPLHRLLARILLDGSDLGLEPWHGHFLLPSWGMGDEFGRLEDGWEKNKNESS